MLLGAAAKVVNDDAAALSPTLGWLLLTCAVAVLGLAILYRERLRQWWLAAEDPRAIAVFRIVFTFFVIANINGMWEYFEFLYTDEGIFTADVARHVFARGQFAGFGDGFGPEDPWGFFDWAAVGTFLKGPKYSLLFFWDSPGFFWAHWVAFELVAIALLVGYRTRLMAVLTWFLMNSILTRNHLGWEGTELVYRCLLAYLVLARSGHAYSVDNWLRCRRLRRDKQLSERGGPGDGAGVAANDEHPQGLEAIYRRIPAWPRKLMMMQLATIYITTGTLKTGSVWLNGDALYYALNLDHFYRLPPQYLSSVAGTTVFRAMTWAVKVGQTSFVLILVGLWTRWLIRQGFTPLVGVRGWLARLGFATLIGCTAAIAAVAWPVHFTPPIAATSFVAAWILLWGGLWLLWRKLTHAPWQIRSWRGRTLTSPIVIDRTWVCRWIIGRRVLLVWHIAFHAHIFTLMNVGQFQTAMLSATFLFLEGKEIAALLRSITTTLARWAGPRVQTWVGRRLSGNGIAPSEDPTLPHLKRDRVHLPVAVPLGGLGIVVGSIVAAAHVGPKAFDWRWGAFASFALLLVGIVVKRQRTAATPNAEDPRGRPIAWSYGPVGRTLVSAGLVWHIAAVATWLLPDKDCLRSFRGPARTSFSVWLRNTTTDQGWGMFAPNPPRSNVFMKVLVTDASGEVYDLRTDVYAAENKPIPWIWNTRVRKMNRRIIGGESGPSDWYRKWYARYECRRWAREHGGETPRKVELVKLWYRIPTPEQTRQRGYYKAEQLLESSGHEKVMHTERCRTAVMGQLPNFIRERDGLPLLDEGTYRPWHKKKKAAWEKKKRKRAEAAD